MLFRSSDYAVLKEEGGMSDAMAEVARRSKQYGDFTPLLFDASLLDRVILEQSPGIPNIDAYKNSSEAEYQGIPYPLP